MKPINTLVLLLIAAAVMAAVYFQKRNNEDVVSSAAIPQRTIPAVTSGTLERIVIQLPGEQPTALTQVDGRWFANAEKQYEADQQAVENVLRAMSAPIKATVVSTNPASYDEYQVSETTATRVQMFKRGDSKPQISLLVGKDGSSAFTTYVRLPDSEEVLNAQAALSMAFKRPDGWRKREVFSFPVANATSIELNGTSGTYTLAKAAEDKWELTAPEKSEADQVKASSIVNMMSSLRAADFVDPSSTHTLASFGLEPARQTVVVHYEDKATSPSRKTSATLLIGNQEGENWYARRTDRPDVILLGDPVVQSLVPSLEEIKVEPPPLAEPEPEAAVTETTATETPAQPADVSSTTTEAAAPPESEPRDAETTSPGSVDETTPAATPAPSFPPAPVATESTATATL